MIKDIFVICDPSRLDNQFNIEMLNKARELKVRNERIVSVVLGDMDMEDCRYLFQAGAQEIIAVQIELPMEAYIIAKCLAELLMKEQPGLVMFPGTTKMKLVAAQTSTYVGAGLTADCIDIKWSDGSYVFLRAALSSSVIAEIRCINSNMQICTVKRGAFVGERMEEKEVFGDTIYRKFISEQNDIRKFLIQPIHVELRKQAKNSITTANIIFAVGRGVEKEYVTKVERVAESCGAAVGCTRAMVDTGLFDKAKQIGQSGNSVRPGLYIAIGISGASQHLVGMYRSKTIIAINKDPEAPIMNYADFGIIRDSKEVIDCLQNIEGEIKKHD